MTDLVVAVFVALLVLGGLYVPRLGDALGRRVRGEARDRGDRPEPPQPGGSPPDRPA